MGQGTPVKLHFQVGEDPSSSRSLNVRFHLWELTAKDELRITLNGNPLTGLRPSVQLGADPSGCWLEESIAKDMVRAGNNEVEVVLEQRNEAVSSELVLDAVQLDMRCS